MYHSLNNKSIHGPKRNFKRFWILFSYFGWLFIYFSMILYSDDIFLIVISVILGIILTALIQAILANKLMALFKYWILVVFFGILLGILWTIIFTGTLIALLALIAFEATPTSGDTDGVQLLIRLGAIQIAYSVIFMGFTYFFWNKIVKPIYHSPRLSEKQRLIYEGIITISGTIYLSITIGFVILLITASNYELSHILSFFLSGWTFSSVSYSAVEEIFEQNLHFQVFESKIVQEGVKRDAEKQLDSKEELVKKIKQVL